MKTIAVDFSGAKLDCWDGSKHFTCRGFEELFTMFNTPVRFVTEATFESFEAGRRAEAIALASEQGHTVCTVPTDKTARERARLKVSKSDANDARIIYGIAFNGHTELGNLHVAPQRKQDMRARANEIGIQLRNHYVARPSANAKSRISEKARLGAELIKALPRFSDLEPKTRAAIGGKSGYSYSVVVDLYIIAQVIDEFGGTAREADFLMGLYHLAYPSVIKAALNRRYRWGDKGVHNQLTFSEYRKELRRLYHQIKHIRTSEEFTASAVESVVTAPNTRPQRGTAGHTRTVDNRDPGATANVTRAQKCATAGTTRAPGSHYLGESP